MKRKSHDKRETDEARTHTHTHTHAHKTHTHTHMLTKHTHTHAHKTHTHIHTHPHTHIPDVVQSRYTSLQKGLLICKHIFSHSQTHKHTP